MLSPKFLPLLRQYWQQDTPRPWLFPGHPRTRPMTTKAVYPLCRHAGQAARLAKAMLALMSCGAYLHTAHHSSIVRICYHHHPFCGQTVAIIRWLRHQTAESLVIQLQDGLQLAIPSWMLDPVACSHVSDAPAPRLSVEALLAVRALLDHQPLLHAAIPATPWVSQPEGARDAQESSSAPTAAGLRALPQPSCVAPAAHRQAPAVSRAHGPTAHSRQP